MNNLVNADPRPGELRLPRNRETGLSLIELMVALTLGLIIVAALSQLFVNISRTNLEMAKTNSQIENARFAMQFLQNDIVHAGYWGGYIPDYDNQAFEDPPDDWPTLNPLPCAAFSTWNPAYIEALLAIPVQVYADVPSDCTGIIPTADKAANTDVLVVRHAATCAAGEAGCDAYVIGDMAVAVSNCFDEIDDDKELSLDPNDMVRYELDCVTPRPTRKFIQNIYYVRDWAYEDSPKDGIPTLMRSQFDSTTLAQGAPVELVEGIEGLRIELGIDRKSQSDENISQTAAIEWNDNDDRVYPKNRGDGVAEGQFELCLSEGACDTGDLPTVEAVHSNVVAVKIYILARANEPSPGYVNNKKYVLGSYTVDAFDDAYKRHVFSTTVRLNNIAGRRDSPDPNEVTP